MQTKFVVRLLSSDGELIAWTQVMGEAKPQGRGHSCPFWPMEPTNFVAERDGIIAKVSVHWTDLDLARMQNLNPTSVGRGQVFNLAWIEPLWLVAGMKDVPLPPVTVRANIGLVVPKGDLNVISHA